MSFGVWNQIMKCMNRLESVEIQLGNRFFYEVAVSRSMMALRVDQEDVYFVYQDYLYIYDTHTKIAQKRRVEMNSEMLNTANPGAPSHGRQGSAFMQVGDRLYSYRGSKYTISDQSRHWNYECRCCNDLVYYSNLRGSGEIETTFLAHPKLIDNCIRRFVSLAVYDESTIFTIGGSYINRYNVERPQ